MATVSGYNAENTNCRILLRYTNLNYSTIYLRVDVRDFCVGAWMVGSVSVIWSYFIWPKHRLLLILPNNLCGALNKTICRFVTNVCCSACGIFLVDNLFFMVFYAVFYSSFFFLINNMNKECYVLTRNHKDIFHMTKK